MGVDTPPSKHLYLIFGIAQPISKKELDSFVSNDETQELIVGNRNSKLCFPLHQKFLDLYYAL